MGALDRLLHLSGPRSCFCGWSVGSIQPEVVFVDLGEFLKAIYINCQYLKMGRFHSKTRIEGFSEKLGRDNNCRSDFACNSWVHRAAAAF